MRWADAAALLLFHIILEGFFETPQLTSEKKPAFGSVDETLVVPLVATGFRQLLFGNRAALGGCKKQHTHPRTLRGTL
jgi:hypothetical protein